MGDYDDILHARRPDPIRPRQTLDNRAKLFQPFDALRGFSLAVLTKQQEQQLVPRLELSDDAQEELQRKLALVRPGDRVLVTCFRPERTIGDLELGAYTTEPGTVVTVDEYSRCLVLAEGLVPLADLLDLQGSVFPGPAEPWGGGDAPEESPT